MIVKTPPMGWNSWNTFGHNIDENLIKETAKAMVDNGFLEAGYDYLVIDDCWAERKRGADGRMVPDPVKFPSGMKALSDYVHSLGLKFGMYSCAGNMTCAGYPGSFDYEYLDAETFASWGVDFLKYDYCFKPISAEGHLLYKRMGLALANCGRDILLSACSWGVDSTEKWIKQTGAHMWRSTGDINDSWQSVKELYFKQLELQSLNGQGCFNDMDMLIVGMGGKGNVSHVGGCTFEEYKTHFSLWAFLNSPLMIGCDIRNASQETRSILLNKDVIAINQDPASRQPFICGGHWGSPEVPMWAKFLDGGDVAIGIFNLSDTTVYPYFSLSDIGVSKVSKKAVSLRDLWTGEELGVFGDIYQSPAMEPHTCRILRAKIVNAD